MSPVKTVALCSSETLVTTYEISKHHNLQGDSLGRDHGLIIINHAIIYRWKLNLASAYLGRCGDNWVTEDCEINFSPPRDKKLRVCESCSQHDRRDCSSCGTGANWAGGRLLSVAKYTVILSLVFISKLPRCL
jgi:hypothetical protein